MWSGGETLGVTQLYTPQKTKEHFISKCRMVVDATILDVILITAFPIQEPMTPSSCTRPTLLHTRRNPGPAEPACGFTMV